MYIPAAFRETDPEKLFAAIERYNFGILISAHGGEPYASHLPLLLERTAGTQGALLGHVARGNLQWQHAEGQSVLAIFPGPHAYISPSWYESPNVVPTWNYVAVHVYGIFRAVRDPAALLQIVADSVKFYEGAMPQPWQLDSQGDFTQKMLQGIVGFRVEITRIEGKWKLNQNHPQERLDKVVRALEARDDADGHAIAALMKALPKTNRG